MSTPTMIIKKSEESEMHAAITAGVQALKAQIFELEVKALNTTDLGLRSLLKHRITRLHKQRFMLIGLTD